MSALLGFGWWLVVWFLFLASLFGVLAFLKPDLGRFWLLAVFLLGLSMGAGRLEFASVEKSSLPSDEDVVLVGKIVAEPEEREGNTRLIVKETITGEKILVFTERFPAYFYGETVQLAGELRQPENFETESGQIFEYEKYLAARDIGRQFFYPEIKKVSPAPWSVLGGLIRLKKTFQQKIEKVIPEPASALASGILLGGKSGLGEELEEVFRRVGISHVVVLSGFNLSIVASYILRALFFLPHAWAISGSVLGVLFFSLMVGGGASVARASVMAILGLLARGYGRIYEAGVALVFAGVLMTLWNPKILIFDLGFQLSFLATLGLIYLSPLIESRLRFVPTRLGLREVISTTLGAQAAVYSWLIYKTGNISLIGFLANIVILPAIPLGMLLSFLTGLAGFLGSFPSLPFAYGSYFVLGYIIKSAQFFARFPLASVTISAPPLWLVLVSYGLLVVFVFWGIKKDR